MMIEMVESHIGVVVYALVQKSSTLFFGRICIVHYCLNLLCGFWDPTFVVHFCFDEFTDVYGHKYEFVALFYIDFVFGQIECSAIICWKCYANAIFVMVNFNSSR